MTRRIQEHHAVLSLPLHRRGPPLYATSAGQTQGDIQLWKKRQLRRPQRYGWVECLQYVLRSRLLSSKWGLEAVRGEVEMVTPWQSPGSRAPAPRPPATAQVTAVTEDKGLHCKKTEGHARFREQTAP